MKKILLEEIADPTEVGYYMAEVCRYPSAAPDVRLYDVMVWRNDTWYDQYGFAPFYGTVFGWAGPFPMLDPAPNWVKRMQDEDIGI